MCVQDLALRVGMKEATNKSQYPRGKNAEMNINVISSYQKLCWQIINNFYFIMLYVQEPCFYNEVMIPTYMKYKVSTTVTVIEMTFSMYIPFLTLSNLGGGGGIRLNGELFSITPKRLKIL